MVHWLVLLHNPAFVLSSWDNSSSGLWMKFFWLGLSALPSLVAGKAPLSSAEKYMLCSVNALKCRSKMSATNMVCDSAPPHFSL